ncbi:MAG: hypothetical protein K6A90_00230 [Lachnospiraceae bacterium]|nr:hypothetical protein [Lachnospiraceae bacterium]
MMKIKRKLGKTDVQYKIICAGSEFDIGADKIVTVCFRGQSYSAKMHKSTKGRIDGLSKLYNDFPGVFTLDNEIDLEYDEEKSEVNITESAANNEFSKVFYALPDEEPSPDEEAESDKDNKERLSPDISDFPVMTVDCDSYSRVMNILHEPYSYGLGAASLGKLTVFYNGSLMEKICVFERDGGEGTYFTTKLRYEGEDSYYSQLPFILKYEAGSVYLYWGNFSAIFRTDIYSGETKCIVKDIDKKSTVFDDSIKAFRVLDNGEVVYLVESLGQNDSHEKMVIKCGHKSWKIPRKYYWSDGEAGELKLCGVTDDTIYCYGNHLFGIDADSGEMNIIFDENMDYDEEEEAYYNLNMCDVLPFRNVKSSGRKEWKSIKDGSDARPFNLRNVYYTAGGDIAIGVTWGDYYFFVARKEESFNDDIFHSEKFLVEKMIHTNAVSVPEDFHMIDGLNAIVRVREHKIAIVDFGERKIYTFNL